MKSVVYFVQIGEHIKVGWSRALQDRLPQLGRDARLLAYFPGNRETERQIHRELEYAHIRGELFQADAVRAFLRELGFELVPNMVFALPARRKPHGPTARDIGYSDSGYRARPKGFSMWDYAKERNKLV